MDGGTFIVLSGALTFGVPLALAVRELMVLRRRDEGGWNGDGPRPVVPKPLPYDWSKPLPACLVPRAPASHVRRLEDA